MEKEVEKAREPPFLLTGIKLHYRLYTERIQDFPQGGGGARLKDFFSFFAHIFCTCKLEKCILIVLIIWISYIGK